LFFFMCCVTIVMARVMEIFKSASITPLDKIYESQVLLRCRRLRANGSRIPESSFNMRRIIFTHDEKGVLNQLAKANENSNPMSMLMNPDSLNSNMSNQFAMIANNLYFFLTYSVINHFFSGFVTAKLPFSLTIGWKSMFQQGIDLRELDVSYVSSSSWFILIISGLRGLNGILLTPFVRIGSYFRNDSYSVATPQSPMGGMGMPNPNKQFIDEKENLQIFQHKAKAETSPTRLIEKFQK